MNTWQNEQIDSGDINQFNSGESHGFDVGTVGLFMQAGKAMLL